MIKKTMLAALTMAGAAAFAEIKIGTVDMLILVRNHPSYEANRKFLADSEQDSRKLLESMQRALDDIQEEGRKAADELKSPMLSDSAKKKVEEKLVGVQQRYIAQQKKVRDEAMRAEQELAKAQQRLLKVQADDLKKRIAEFAAANGYDLVVDSSAAMFFKPEYDVTDRMLEAMGVDPKTAREKEKNAGK